MKILAFKWSQKQDLRGCIFSEKCSVCYVSRFDAAPQVIYFHNKFQFVVCIHLFNASLSCENMYRIDVFEYTLDPN